MADLNTRYRIKLTVVVYQNKKLVHKNDMVVPTTYRRRSEARAHITREKKERLKNTNFFISPRADFDMVRYSEQASLNTYIRYRILEERPWAPVQSEDRKAERMYPIRGH